MKQNKDKNKKNIVSGFLEQQTKPKKQAYNNQIGKVALSQTAYFDINNSSSKNHSPHSWSSSEINHNYNLTISTIRPDLKWFYNLSELISERSLFGPPLKTINVIFDSEIWYRALLFGLISNIIYLVMYFMNVSSFLNILIILGTYVIGLVFGLICKTLCRRHKS